MTIQLRCPTPSNHGVRISSNSANGVFSWLLLGLEFRHNTVNYDRDALAMQAHPSARIGNGGSSKKGE